MKKCIKNFSLVLLLITAISGQSAIAADNELNTYVYDHLEDWDTEFSIDYFNKSDVLDLIRDIAKKDDYLYVSLKRIEYQTNGRDATVTVYYKTTKEEEEYINQELTKVMKSIITDNMSEVDKVKAINKYLVNRFKYDTTYESNNAYTALTTGKTACQGYAMTAYKMLKLAGIENKIIVGEIDGVAHGWNLVKLNDKWYHLDITNNDSVGSDKYFLRKDSVLKNDGFTWNASDYPQCNEDYIYKSNNANTQSNNNSSVQASSGYKSNIDGSWSLNNGNWYFLRNTNAYAKGWNLIDNKWYFFDYDGVMKTGWIYYGGKWYYCYPGSGAMATNTVINGYTVDWNGAWVS